MKNKRLMRTIKRVLLYIMGLFYILGGLNHFISPDFYLQMMPDYLPAHEFLVGLSGVVEIGLGIAVLIPKFQWAAAWGIVLLLIAVFPANLNMYLHAEDFPSLSETALLMRLPLQAVLILWAWWYTRRTQ